MFELLLRDCFSLATPVISAFPAHCWTVGSQFSSEHRQPDLLSFLSMDQVKPIEQTFTSKKLSFGILLFANER